MTANSTCYDLNRMAYWMITALQAEAVASGGAVVGPDSAGNLSKEATRALFLQHPEKAAEYVCWRRGTGKQASALPHVQSFLGLTPQPVIKASPSPRVDSIMAPDVRASESPIK